MPQSKSSDDGQHRLCLIDLFRFIAALSVLVFHYFFRAEQGGFVPPLHLPQWLSGAAAYGGMGVYLFFVISGFVIAYSAHGRSAWSFAASRFARLYPTYVLAMTLTALVLSFAAAQGQRVGITQFVANLFMFPKLLHQPMVDGVYWSIQYEVLFYAWVFVFLITGLFDRWLPVIAGAWLAIAVANTWVLHSGALALLFLTQYAGLFATGLMLFRVRQEGVTLVNITLLGAAMVASFFACHQELEETLTLYGAHYSVSVFVVLMTGIFVVMTFAAFDHGRMRGAGAMVALGALTYPLYLLHQMIGYAAITRLIEPLGGATALVVVTALMLGLAAIINRVFERPVVPAVRRASTHAFIRLGLEK